MLKHLFKKLQSTLNPWWKKQQAGECPIHHVALEEQEGWGSAYCPVEGCTFKQKWDGEISYFGTWCPHSKEPLFCQERLTCKNCEVYRCKT